MPLLNLILTLIVLGFAFWLLSWAINKVPYEPFRVGGHILLAIAAVLVLLQYVLPLRL